MESVKPLICENLIRVVKELYDLDVETVHLEHPGNMKWGDYSTNIAFNLAGHLQQSPVEIAKALTYELQASTMTFTLGENEYTVFDSVDFASPGFINFTISQKWLKNVLYFAQTANTDYGRNENLLGKKVVIEYTDPNPFKVFHIGHLMSNCIGESLSRFLEFSGAEVVRANYQGDVGMHVAKSIWGMATKMSDESKTLEYLESLALDKRLDFLGQSYALGAIMYKENEVVAEEIKQLNYLVFAVAQEYLRDTTAWETRVDYFQYIKDVEGTLDYDTVRTLYIKGRAWSLEGFEQIYARLGTVFDSYYFESVTGELGYMTVQEGLKNNIFVKESGATIFKGDSYGLHTRVFINSLGLPTYEAKDLGLAFKKYEDYTYDMSIVVTGNEIDDYFKVVLQVLSIINSDLADKTRHISHGMMRLSSGKMSSRTGKVVTGVSLIDDIKQVVAGKMEKYDDEIADQIAVAALKYDILKQGIGKNIVFDKEKSLSITGDTGPYLQYTYARACSLIEKSTYEHSFDIELERFSFLDLEVADSELDLLRRVYIFPEIVSESTSELSPTILCTYLFDIAQSFNHFYSDLPILNADSELVRDFRLLLAKCVSVILQNGLWLLGIRAPDHV
jgi:arginyl-tRNA synthetase